MIGLPASSRRNSPLSGSRNGLRPLMNSAMISDDLSNSNWASAMANAIERTISPIGTLVRTLLTVPASLAIPRSLLISLEAA